MYDKKQSGNRLKHLREATEKTQAEVAKEIGLSVDTICKLEQGRRSPSVTVVDLLARYYKTTADYIISGYGEPTEESKELFENVPEQKRAAVERLMENIKELIT